MDNSSFPIKVKKDLLTSAIPTIDYPHHELHAGNHYYMLEQTLLGNGETRTFIVSQPDTLKWGHFIFATTAAAEITIKLTEGVSVEALGTPITTINNNRNSPNMAAVLVYHTPTNPTGGTVIVPPTIVGAGVQVGGTSRNDNELILKQNTLYMLEITNGTALGNLLTQLFDWYEHTAINT